MKTVMQELQEKITGLINDSKGDDTRTGDYRIGLHQALGLIDLEAEKEQIMEAYNAGKNNVDAEKFISSIKYYQQKYKSDE